MSFFNIFFNRNSKYNTRNHFIPKILHCRLPGGRISPFGPQTAETRVSACGRPTCMCSGQAAVRAPPFRPADGRSSPFGSLAAETCQPRPRWDLFPLFFLLSSPCCCAFPLSLFEKKAPPNSRLISKNSQESTHFIPQK